MPISSALGLSGTLWPIHPHPCQDELFTSWIARISRSYGMGPSQFWQLLFQCGVGPSDDAQYGLNENIFRTFSTKTGVPLDRVLATTTLGYNKVLLSALKFCPDCLREDSAPYFRRQWRFSFVHICKWHRVELISQCPRCHQAINFLRIPLRIRSLAMCASCLFHFQAAVSRPISNQTKALEALRFQERLAKVVENVRETCDTGARIGLVRTHPAVELHPELSNVPDFRILHDILSELEAQIRFLAPINLDLVVLASSFLQMYSATVINGYNGVRTEPEGENDTLLEYFHSLTCPAPNRPRGFLYLELVGHRRQAGVARSAALTIAPADNASGLRPRARRRNAHAHADPPSDGPSVLKLGQTEVTSAAECSIPATKVHVPFEPDLGVRRVPSKQTSAAARSTMLTRKRRRMPPARKIPVLVERKLSYDGAILLRDQFGRGPLLCVKPTIGQPESSPDSPPVTLLDLVDLFSRLAETASRKRREGSSPG